MVPGDLVCSPEVYGDKIFTVISVGDHHCRVSESVTSVKFLTFEGKLEMHLVLNDRSTSDYEIIEL